jgi:hypothetical protein
MTGYQTQTRSVVHRSSNNDSEGVTLRYLEQGTERGGFVHGSIIDLEAQREPPRASTAHAARLLGPPWVDDGKHSIATCEDLAAFLHQLEVGRASRRVVVWRRRRGRARGQPRTRASLFLSNPRWRHSSATRGPQSRHRTEQDVPASPRQANDDGRSASWTAFPAAPSMLFHPEGRALENRTLPLI